MQLATSYTGLDSKQVEQARKENGSNAIELEEDRVLWHVLREVVTEPMFLLLLTACTVYFIVGQYQEGFIMLAAIFIVSGISIFQEYRSRNAVQALKKMAAPQAQVIRGGRPQHIPTEEIVTGDILLLEEGEVIGADGLLLSANDFSVNESLLTGESLPVFKTAGNNTQVYKGSLVSSGGAVVEVSAVGIHTLFGKIGLSLKEVTVIKTPLQEQIRIFVRNMVIFGVVAFILVFAYNYYDSRDFIHALMHGLTLAMSVIPEEIPVAFSTFMALGAFRLLRNQIIVKQPQYVETLGSATVICTDKTGTLTQNRMSIAYVYDAIEKKSISCTTARDLPSSLVAYAMWASETNPFDPMEKAIHELYRQTVTTDERLLFRQVHEYPIGGKPPMMTHIFSDPSGHTLIAAKGAPEAILRQGNLPVAALKHIEEQALEYARKGYRVLGVGRGQWEGRKWPVSQEEFSFEFLGLLAFYDPPKENISATIQTFADAGIAVKMITGDYPETALAIANQVQLLHNNEVLTGKEVLQLSNEELYLKAREINIYARMFPEAKLRVIEALREDGEVVAMTGDGVNDGPALKAAHIGIAMGQRGSEVAKSAASLILTDDDLGHMTDAVALGRKIYDNLKKAIQYIVSIHIPIILVVTLPLLLLWKFTDFFSPVHVIFLELIMGPTCSIIYENEPMEPGTMQRKPRLQSSSFLSARQLLVSVLQGLLITAGCLGLGYYYIQDGAGETHVRTVIFITLLFSNIFLTLVNRSFRYTVFTTLRYKNNLVLLIILLSLAFIGGLLYLPYLQQLFRLETLQPAVLLTSFLTALAATGWIEIFKAIRLRTSTKT